jgi:PAP2 superfamily protein
MQPEVSTLVPRRMERAYAWIQILAAALILILAAGVLKIGSAPYIAFAFAGSFLIFVCTSPSRAEIAWSVAAGAAFALIYYLHGGLMLSYFGSEIGTTGGFLGMGAVEVLAARMALANPDERPASLRRLRDAALIPSLCLGSMIAVSIAAYLTPITYDPVIYDFDLKFGGPPSWVVGAAFRSQPWLFSLAGHAYNCLPLALSACLLLDTRRLSRHSEVNLMFAILLLGVAGFALYQICPVSGPVYLFPHDFPSHVPALAKAAPSPLQEVPRNGMPSLHVAWTLLLFWNLRRRPVLAAVCLGLLVLTILATLGSGEHYLADLIVAPPLVLAIQSVCSRGDAVRLRWAFILGAAATLAWLIAFRTGIALSIPSGAPVWSLAFLSLALPAGVARWAKL